MKRNMTGFLIVGILAFGVDAGGLWLLMQAGIPPLPARLASLAVAMTVAWYGNRTFSFQVDGPPTWHEYLRYLTLAGGVAVLNYTVYALLVAGWQMQPVLATALATGVSMVFSFSGMKFGVFRR